MGDGVEGWGGWKDAAEVEEGDDEDVEEESGVDDGVGA